MMTFAENELKAIHHEGSHLEFYLAIIQSFPRSERENPAFWMRTFCLKSNITI